MLRIDRQRLSTDDPKTAQNPVTAMDLGNKMGHAQAQVLPPLAAGADHHAAAIAERVAFRRPPGVFPAGSHRDSDPRSGQGSPRREGL